METKKWGRNREENAVEGVIVPEGLEAIRDVAEWLRGLKGVTVPFLNREGLLVRVEYYDNEAVYEVDHVWVETGELVGLDWDGTSVVNYGPARLWVEVA